MARTARQQHGPDRPSAAAEPPLLLPTVLATTATLVAIELVHPAGSLGWIAYLLATVGAVALAAVGTARHPRAERVPWALVTAALAISSVADLTYLGITGIDPTTEPDSSWADVLWLACYLPLGLGVLLLGPPGRRLPLRDGLLDLAAAATVGIVVVSQLSVTTTLTDPTLTLPIRLLWVAYPLLDTTILVVVLHRLVTTDRPGRPTWLLALGVSAWLAADLVFLAPDADGFVVTVLDACWMVGSVLLALAAWPAPRPVAGRDDHEGRAVLRLAVIGLAPLLLPGLVELHGYLTGEDANPVPLLMATLVLVVLAFLRVLRLVQSGRALRDDLRASEHFHRAIADHAADAVIVLDERGRLLHDRAIASVERLIGPWPDGDAATDPRRWVHPDDLVQARALFRQALEQPEVVSVSELRLGTPAAPAWIEARVVNLLDDPDVGGIVVHLHDISGRKQAEAELAHHTFHDPVTGLANRALLHDRLGLLLARVQRIHGEASVVHVGLDGFARINETLGRDRGDEVLCIVADRVRLEARAGDTVARLGGDELAVLAEGGDGSAPEAARIAERILGAVGAPILLDDQEIVLSASVGVATAGPATTASSLLSDADVAMHRAKEAGGGRWLAYEADMRMAALARLRLEQDLASAIERDLLLHYQPVVDLAAGRLVGFEALVRWAHPALGTLGPDHFVPVAEQSGQIDELGRWVLRTACAAAARWRQQPGHDLLTMAVNVSGRQLASPTIVDDVGDALDAASLEGRSLVLEITESTLVEDPAAAASSLGELRDLGCHIAIDDFGTGYSSLAYLRTLPVDVLKLDKGFVAMIGDEGEPPPLLRGLLDLGRSLSLTVVAEGVETPAQHRALHELGCPFGQGYLFSPPLGAEDAEPLLQHGTSVPGLTTRT